MTRRDLLLDTLAALPPRSARARPLRVAAGVSPLGPLVHPHGLREGGLVMRDEHVKVTATLVDHAPVTPAFASTKTRRRRR
jgi:hypothetical protein